MSRTTNMKALHAQLNKLGLMDEKAAIIEEWTEGATARARDLGDGQLHALVQHLNRMTCDMPRQRMIRKLYFCARQLGWYAPNGKGGVQPDATRLNAWCIKYTTAHVCLQQMTEAQLAQAVTAMEKYVASDTLKNAR